MAALVCSVSLQFSHTRFDSLAKVVDARPIRLPISGSMERLSVTVKKTLNISIMFINYRQRVIAVYFNYGSRPSKTLGSELESEIMQGMAKFGKRVKKSEGRLSSSVPQRLLLRAAGSPPQFHQVSFFFFHVRSAAALHHLVA